jgi:hypothetical protein
MTKYAALKATRFSLLNQTSIHLVHIPSCLEDVGASTSHISHPYGPSWPVTGIALLFYPHQMYEFWEVMKAYTTRRTFGQVYTTENICM